MHKTSTDGSHKQENSQTNFGGISIDFRPIFMHY